MEQQILENGFLFESSDHIRYQGGQHVSGPHGGARRALEIERAQSTEAEPEIYRVTLYNLDGTHPVWRDNIQMAPKRMAVIEEDENRIVLRGYGNDAHGFPFSDYGLTIHLNEAGIEKCVLHLLDRGVDIEYLA